MYAKVATLALVAGALAQTIQTPASLIECQPALLSFSGGTAPYIIAALPGGEVSASAIEYIAEALTGTSYTWTVNLASGTNITLRLSDSTGAIGYSSPVVIQEGASSSCLNTTASTSGLTSGAVTTTVTSSTTAAAAATTSAAASSVSSVSSAAASSASSASSAASSAAAAATSSAAASTSSAASSAAAATSSAAASASASSTSAGEIVAAIPGLGAVAAGLLGGLALLF